MENYIFWFNDRDPLEFQSNEVCQELWEDIWSFVEKSKQNDTNIFDANHLIELKSKYCRIEWLARYGAAVLFWSLRADRLKACVVGLDKWKLGVHASAKERTPISIPDFRDPSLLQSQEFDAEKLEKIWKTFQAKLAESEQNNTGDRRGQHVGHMGNQKTPSFAHHLLRSAISEIESGDFTKSKLQGGTTDVGSHTGCIKRNTSYPLVLSVLRAITVDQTSLPRSSELFEKCLAWYLMQIAETITNPHGNIYDARYCDKIIYVLREARRFVAHVTDKAFKNLMMTKMECHFQELENLRLNESDSVCVESFEEALKNLESPSLPSFDRNLGEVSSLTTLEKSRQLALKNLGRTNVYTDVSLYDAPISEEDCWVQLHRFNEHFWELSKCLDKDSTPNVADEMKNLQFFTNLVEKIVEKCARNHHVMKVLMRSYKALATWIVCCLSHLVAERQFPIFKNYGTALLSEDMEVWVLDDERARKAASRVSNFLSERSYTDRPFRDADSTLMLGLQVARNHSTMRDAVNGEMRLANECLDARWKKIQEKQKKLRELDPKLSVALSKLADAQSDVNFLREHDCSYNRYGHFIEGSGYKEAVRNKNRAEQTVSNLRNQIRSLERKPDDIDFALPKGEVRALQWTFFLLMPVEFQNLSALVHASQTVMRKICPQSSAWMSLRDWFSRHKRFWVESLPIPTLGLCSRSQKPRIGTPGIRSYTRETGVFFPDSLSIDPLWKGTDPFNGGSKRESTLVFTEILPQPGENSRVLQDLIPMLPSGDRENWFVMTQQKHPSWMSPDEMDAFCSLRACPRSQFRALLDCISTNRLHFDSPCVHTLVRQAIYQIGSEDWFTDTLPEWKGLDLLAKELSMRLEILRETPSNWEQMMIFGSVCSFFGQRDGACAKLSCQYSDALLSLAAEMENGQESIGISLDFYQKLGRMYGAAIFCHSVGEIDESRTEKMLKSSVLLKHALLFERAVASSCDMGSQQFQSKLEPFVQVMQSIMSEKVHRMVELIRRSPSMLTDCVALVTDGALSSLSWSPIKSKKGSLDVCYEAIHRRTVYSVNLLNGSVLINGAPPGLLPKSITDDPLFRRTFGKNNFEVSSEGFCKYKTARKHHGGVFYVFSESSNGNLEISQIHETWSVELVLLDRTAQEIDLPIRLRDLYSHWLIPEKNLVLVQGVTYEERDVHYVMTESDTYIVPFSHRKASLDAILGSLYEFNRMLRGSTGLLKSLRRFENEAYIHVSVDDVSRCIQYSMPRLTLDFKQKDGKVICTQFHGFALLHDQALNDTLPGLSQTLILKDVNENIKVLIPDGTVSETSTINVTKALDSAVKYRVYDEHKRLKSLHAVDIEDRLHLAALYAANGSSLIYSRSGRTGFDTSIDLLRQCWKNEPFSPDEGKKLQEVAHHSKLCCSLQLMCSYLSDCANRCCFLHEETSTNCSPVSIAIDTLALDEYHCKARTQAESTVPLLLISEETSLLCGIHFLEDAFASTCKWEAPINDFVRNVDKQLSSQVSLKSRSLKISLKRKNDVFPLKISENARDLELRIMSELKESYKIYKSDPEWRNRDVKHGLMDVTKAALHNVKQRRQLVQEKVLNSLTATSDERRMVLYSGMMPRPDVRDILLLLTDPSRVIRDHLLSTRIDMESIQMTAINWALLCVLEDKLGRIIDACFSNDVVSAIKDLKSDRKWDPILHCRWLAFEVEQQLQIRPYQYDIVQQLIDDPGSMVQLNMGEGKTRVLVPMLILEWAGKPFLTRLNVLPPIFHEAVEYYRNALVASVQGIKLYTLPFNRKILMNEKRARLISDEMTRCKETAGFMVVSPRHRNSLLLKQYDENIFVKGLSYEARDIIDECDAILHHDFQLVYALGEQIPLPDGNSRWNAVECLLLALSRSFSPTVHDSRIVHRENTKKGVFPKIRLLQPFFEEEKIGKDLALNLLESMLMNPTHEFRWMLLLGNEEKNLLLDIVLLPESDAHEMLSKHPSLTKHRHDILSLRGCLSFGLLFHGLATRHRVNYGLNGNSNNLMAVPFSAADTPKDAAEFSHPDMAIIYTTLSWLYTGLSLHQFELVLKKLDEHGLPSKRAIYRSWLDSARSDTDMNAVQTFDDIAKVDLSNRKQLLSIYECLGNSMLVVFYWLNNFVFPTETQQFPAKRATSAWNLVSNTSIGFSGTDDTKLLLPLAVKQKPTRNISLHGTNGMMIDKILQCTSTKIHRLKHGSSSDVTDLCGELEVDALIDVGGIMAGTTNKKVAEAMASRAVEQTIEKYRGIVFFDTKRNQWFVLEIAYRRFLPLKSSSLSESECFVYFDESRCRGSDMKLRHDASALVTLEPRMTKDKFLQGCARMRKLGSDGQRIVLAGPPEVITGSSSVTSILEMIVHNTMLVTRRGLPTYLQHGIDFSTFPKPQNIKLSLNNLYGQPTKRNLGFLEHLDAQSVVETESNFKFDEVVLYCKDIGKDLVIRTGGLGQECERELEEEEEEEEQQEIELPEKQPHSQTDWDFHRIFTTNHVGIFNSHFLPLRRFIRTHLTDLRAFGWSEKVFCSHNFWRTIHDYSSSGDMSNYIRLVGPMLVFKDGRVVLLSMYELDKILPHWWKWQQKSSDAPSCIVENISRVFKPSQQKFGRTDYGIPVDVLTSIKLFCGIVDYTEEEKAELTKILSNVGRVRHTVENLLMKRHQLIQFERSDLEAVCDTFDS